MSTSPPGCTSSSPDGTGAPSTGCLPTRPTSIPWSIWSLLRRGWLSDTAFAAPEHLIQTIRPGLRAIQYCPDLINGCIRNRAVHHTHDNPSSTSVTHPQTLLKGAISLLDRRNLPRVTSNGMSSMLITGAPRTSQVGRIPARAAARRRLALFTRPPGKTSRKGDIWLMPDLPEWRRLATPASGASKGCPSFTDIDRDDILLPRSSCRARNNPSSRVPLCKIHRPGQTERLDRIRGSSRLARARQP